MDKDKRAIVVITTDDAWTLVETRYETMNLVYGGENLNIPHILTVSRPTEAVADRCLMPLKRINRRRIDQINTYAEEMEATGAEYVIISECPIGMPLEESEPYAKEMVSGTALEGKYDIMTVAHYTGYNFVDAAAGLTVEGLYEWYHHELKPVSDMVVRDYTIFLHLLRVLDRKPYQLLNEVEEKAERNLSEMKDATTEFGIARRNFFRNCIDAIAEIRKSCYEDEKIFACG